MSSVHIIPTILNFAERNRITMEYRETESNLMFVGDVPLTSRHFEVTLRYDGRAMTATFTMTPEHGDVPYLGDVLASVANECFVWENLPSFSRGELGDLAYKVQELLGQERYRELVFETRH